MAFQEKGIDVSHWQNDRGAIDWKKVKAAGVDFVIVKATERTSYVDPYFKRNVQGAKAAGLKVGAYHFARFANSAQVQQELDHFLKNIKGMGLDYPAVLDLETNDHKLSSAKLTDLAIEFMQGLEKAGYFAMLYTGKSFLENTLQESRLSGRFALWIARYNSFLGRDADMWQYTSTGTINGIKGSVDVNWNYRSDLMGETGMGTKTPAPAKPAPAAPKPSVGGAAIYKVQSGDTLSEIAAAHGVSTNDLVKWNNIKNANQIQVGQVLSVRGTATNTAQTHKIVAGDTLSEIAVKYGTTVAKLKQLNGLKSDVIYAGKTLRVK